MNIKSVLIIRSGTPSTTTASAKVASVLKKMGVNCSVFTVTEAKQLKGSIAKNIGFTPDLIISLGGDGTMLSVISLFIHENIPFSGINMGRLGFLTDNFYKNTKSYIEDLRSEHAKSEKRMVLSATVTRDNKVVYKKIASNDFIFKNATSFHLTELDLKVNGESINRERGDGLIVCTPTGSTAYSMSNGGPVIFPDMSCICVTPISPHYLSHRPLILPSTSVITISIDSVARGDVHISDDGRSYFSIVPGDIVSIKKYSKSAILCQHPKYSYFQVLRKKLLWGAISHPRANAPR